MNAASGGRREPLILLVEDDEDSYNLYSDCLAMSGFSVIGASDGNEAIEIAIRLEPDLVIMDLGLPILDGCEATRRLRTNPRTRATPVLALTGFVQPYYIELARQAGCDAFLGKPCPVERLLYEARRLTGITEESARLRRGRILLVEDDDDIREHLAAILERSGYYVTEARHGREALEILNAADEPPSLIVLDLMMPVMDGWEFRAAQLEDERLSAIPVVAISAVANFKRAGSTLRVAEYVAKPIQIDFLLSTLERLC
jgi:CheY-like chemotaxis protein